MVELVPLGYFLPNGGPMVIWKLLLVGTLTSSQTRRNPTVDIRGRLRREERQMTICTVKATGRLTQKRRVPSRGTRGRDRRGLKQMTTSTVMEIWLLRQRRIHTEVNKERDQRGEEQMIICTVREKERLTLKRKVPTRGTRARDHRGLRQVTTFIVMATWPSRQKRIHTEVNKEKGRRGGRQMITSIVRVIGLLTQRKEVPIKGIMVRDLRELSTVTTSTMMGE